MDQELSVEQIAEKIKEEMVSNKIKKISVAYSGSGDSGEISNIEFSPTFVDNHFAITDLFWSLIDKTHGDFETGGGGEIVAVIKKGELTLSHDYYDFVESKSSAPVIKI